MGLIQFKKDNGQDNVEKLASIIKELGFDQHFLIAANHKDKVYSSSMDIKEVVFMATLSALIDDQPELLEPLAAAILSYIIMKDK